MAVALAFAAGTVSPAAADVLINVDKTTQRMTVSVDGLQRWEWPVSTGMPGRDTPSGSYKTFRMEKDHFSKEWDDAPMPNSIFFTMKGHAIHGSYDVRHLGQPVSHGCVRIAPKNAEKLFQLVKQEGLSHTRVVLTGDVETATFGNTPGQRERNPFEGFFSDAPPRDPFPQYWDDAPRRRYRQHMSDD
jgi:lipoprotein-anchoring transpeptidase ErfK/SrfK